MHHLGRELEIQCALLGVSPSDVLREAKINPSTWSRWKAGRTPELPSVQRFLTAANLLYRRSLGDRPAKANGSDDLKRTIAIMAERRRQLKISQATLSSRMGYSDNLVAQWESFGKSPTGFNLACWAQSLGLQLTVQYA